MEHNMHWSCIPYMVSVDDDKIVCIITWSTFCVISVLIFMIFPFLSICLKEFLEMK